MSKKANASVLLAITAALTLILAACGKERTAESSGQPTDRVELIISAAASMKDALTDIQQSYETANPSVKLRFNFGASGALQQQIEQGAPADLFLSAAAKNMKQLVEEQWIDSSRQVELLRNELVVVVPSEAASVIETLEDLTKKEVKVVAIGIPESVPAGNYAKEALANANLWDSLQSKTVLAKDVRQVLQYVTTGNADAGFVYMTDALTTDKAKVAFTVNEAMYPPIVYPIGIVKATHHREEAEALYRYLQSREALDVFAKYGFNVVK